jgi:hypothetical protein
MTVCIESYQFSITNKKEKNKTKNQCVFKKVRNNNTRIHNFSVFIQHAVKNGKINKKSIHFEQNQKSANQNEIIQIQILI